MDSSQAEEEGNTGLALAECSCSSLDEVEEKDTEVKCGKETAKTSLMERYAPHSMSWFWQKKKKTPMRATRRLTGHRNFRISLPDCAFEWVVPYVKCF